MSALKLQTAVPSFGSAHGQAPIIYPEKLKNREILLHLRDPNDPWRTNDRWHKKKNWFKARNRKDIIIIPIDSVNEVYDFLKREKDVGVTQEDIKIFYDGYTYTSQKFKRLFKEGDILWAKKKIDVSKKVLEKVEPGSTQLSLFP